MPTSNASAATPADARAVPVPRSHDPGFERPLRVREWLAVSVLAAGLLAIALGAARFWAPHGVEWLALQTRDGRPDIARPALLTLAGEAQRADVVLWGDSSVREAYVSDGELQAALASRGQRVRVVNLASSAQQLTDALYIVSLGVLPPGQTHVVHLRFSSLRLDPWARMAAGVHLAMPEVGEPVLAPMLGNGLARTRLLWRLARERLLRAHVEPLQRTLRAMLYRVAPAATVPHDMDKADHVATPQKLLDLRHEAQRELAASFDDNLKVFEQGLEAFVAKVERSGGTVVLATVPHTEGDLAVVESGRASAFDRTVETVARRHGLQRIDLNTVAAPRPVDIADLTHVNASGRRRWSAAFADWLAGRAGAARDPQAAR